MLVSNIFVLGTIAYFASWIPPLLELGPRWTWLGPYVLPALSFTGLGLWARSPAYVVGAAAFVLAHAAHGVLAVT